MKTQGGGAAKMKVLFIQKGLNFLIFRQKDTFI